MNAVAFNDMVAGQCCIANGPDALVSTHSPSIGLDGLVSTVALDEMVCW